MRKKTKELLEIGIAKLYLIKDGLAGRAVNPYQKAQTNNQMKAFFILQKFYSRYERVWVPKKYSTIFDPIFKEELKNRRIRSLLKIEEDVLIPVKREIPPFLRSKRLYREIFLSFVRMLKRELSQNRE